VSIRQHSFWASPWAVAIIGGTVAIIIGGVVLAALTPGQTTNSSGLPSSPSSSKPRASTTPAPTTSATSHTATPAYYQRPIPVGISSGGNGLDFDIKPPGPGPGPASFFYDTFALKKGGSSTVGFGFAVWMKSGTPTASDCKTWVSTHLVDHVYAPATGTKICFRTDQGRVGLLIVKPGTSENQFNAIARVWGS
jgi:hypothetical protein